MNSRQESVTCSQLVTVLTIMLRNDVQNHRFSCLSADENEPAAPIMIHQCRAL